MPPCTLYLVNGSSKFGYDKDAPAKSMNEGVAGTLQNLGTGLMNLNCFDILTLSISMVFLDPADSIIYIFFPSEFKKSILSPVKTNFFVRFYFGFPASLKSISYKLSYFTYFF